MDSYSMFPWIGNSVVISVPTYLQIQCKPNQNPTRLFCGYQQTDSKVYNEVKKKKTE